MNMGVERQGFQTYSEFGEGLAPCEGRNPPSTRTAGDKRPTMREIRGSSFVGAFMLRNMLWFGREKLERVGKALEHSPNGGGTTTLDGRPAIGHLQPA
jgi:hypothetical protein